MSAMAFVARYHQQNVGWVNYAVLTMRAEAFFEV
jgi:hypothetical protein